MLAWGGLRHRYAGGAEIAYADFGLAAGRHLLLRGASGTGKSTLLALLAGLLRVQRGELVVAGTELAGLGPRALDAWRGATLGVVPQRLHLSDALTVAENLALPALAVGQRADSARAAELLEALDIADLSARRPHQLSVGQAQRVALARALMRSRVAGVMTGFQWADKVSSTWGRHASPQVASQSLGAARKTRAFGAPRASSASRTATARATASWRSASVSTG